MLSNCGAGEDSWELLRLQANQPVDPKANQPLIVIGRTDAKAPTFGHLMQRADSLVKILDAGEDWSQEENGATENDMVGWHHQLNGHDFEQTPGIGEGQGSLVCCSPWGHKAGCDLATKQQQIKGIYRKNLQLKS